MISLSHRLAALAEAGRTGALHVGGTPGGVVYLVAGRITYAESPACPGIGERLVGCGRLSAAQWRAAYEAGHGTRSVGRLLLRDGHLGHHELACRVVASITAATHALLQGDEGALRFVPGERHWFGTIAQADLGNLGPEAARRLLARPAPCGPRPVRHRPRPDSPR
ncbi:hypothetical protein Asp14428_29690 [Actinoplanes sp. NBRC 14428]|uniref:Uncharacterized protein DUF4388 n=1 Tax=Pseudosporangium ferrugineum TaxID=439699 RepID=A0A2T0RS01_9ACTN|nr:DUF4388 domain-containing protein [Pseudosporangium ferrugineum]PRY23931.1 uncharacterized protein DUF4388 [Pseudosporangium ferrugineum]BCJ51494.1 hypothetical protein Asp14428_29690 [Actinoplanes sp. NBRC 14428]